MMKNPYTHGRKRVSAHWSRLAWLFILACFSSSAQTDNSLLWRVSGNGLKHPSYLFGTIHLICADRYLWTPVMEAAFDSSQKVCFELDLSDPNMMSDAAQMMVDLSGKKLKDYFTTEQYAALTQYFQKNGGIDLEMMQQMKPFVLQMFMVSSSAGCERPASYEDSLMHRATAMHKTISGLEVVKEQIDVLEKTPTAEIIADVMKAAAAPDEVDSGYGKMVDVYVTQDLPQLYNLIINDSSLKNELGLFLDERNKKWVGRIAEKMAASPTFFAVGAGHLYGSNGIIALLRRAGYTVVPVH
jgi:uncharacterized protein